MQRGFQSFFMVFNVFVLWEYVAKEQVVLGHVDSDTRATPRYHTNHYYTNDVSWNSLTPS